MAAALSRAVTVHRAHFTMDLVVAFRFLKDGVRVCVRSLFCVCAARKQRPGSNKNHKRTDKHFGYVDLGDGKSSNPSDFRFVGRLCQTPI
jgi:hypothetical protein